MHLAAGSSIPSILSACSLYVVVWLHLKPVFHFARIVPKRTGEHAQIEKMFINPRTSGCFRRIKIKSSSLVNFFAYYEVLTPDQHSRNFEI
jgi:hypothetical protein